jgi:hypothetical protein
LIKPHDKLDNYLDIYRGEPVAVLANLREADTASDD